jgi:hypothetical protein
MNLLPRRCRIPHLHLKPFHHGRAFAWSGGNGKSSGNKPALSRARASSSGGHDFSRAVTARQPVISNGASRVFLPCASTLIPSIGGWPRLNSPKRLCVAHPSTERVFASRTKFRDRTVALLPALRPCRRAFLLSLFYFLLGRAAFARDPSLGHDDLTKFQRSGHLSEDGNVEL